MKSICFHPLALLLLCLAAAHAQDISSGAPSTDRLDEYMETGMEVSGVRAPYYDEEGNLKAQLFGGHARILEGGIADVSNIRIDVYEKGAVAMTVYAPQCFTRVVERGREKVLTVESDGDVLIETEQMTISGKGFRFSSDSSRFEILSEPRVLVKQSARGVKGLGL